MNRRVRPCLSVVVAALLTGGCSEPPTDAEILTVWCDAVNDMLAASEVLAADPATLTEDDLEAAAVSAREFFAVRAPEEVRPHLEALQDPNSDAELDDTAATARAFSDFVEANCDGIDPAFFAPGA